MSTVYGINDMQITDGDALATFVTYSNYNTWMIWLSSGRYQLFRVDDLQIVQSLADGDRVDVLRRASEKPVDCVIMDSKSDVYIFWGTIPVILEWLSCQEYVKLAHQNNFSFDVPCTSTKHEQSDTADPFSDDKTAAPDG
jgi:hypothetical protein